MYAYDTVKFASESFSSLSFEFIIYKLKKTNQQKGAVCPGGGTCKKFMKQNVCLHFKCRCFRYFRFLNTHKLG